MDSCDKLEISERARVMTVGGDIPVFDYGIIWEDPIRGHKVGCLDATSRADVVRLMNERKAALVIQDPPYNIDIGGVFTNMPIDEYIKWSEKWVDNTITALDTNASLYIWLGADIKKGFQPLPDFMIMMRSKPVETRNCITMRNQRGYGTQKNWMAVRQELLYYTKGDPTFHVQYTNIPKKTKGYYKVVNGKRTENLERSKSRYIRPGNVWFDIQQVFYLLEENVEGCYAQKPLKAIERIMHASTNEGDLVIDFFAHSGTTLLQAEISKRQCYTMDISPDYCRIAVERLLNYRTTGQLGWGRTKVLEKGSIVKRTHVKQPALFET